LEKFQIHTDPKVQAVFDEYPVAVRKKLMNLRSIIIETAKEIEEVTSMEETLKWGEPSYLVKKGSTIRIDWKPKTPDQYAIYFKCTSALVPTFRMVYNGLFNFEGNRAITFQMEEKIPTMELKNCIRATLRYHKVKQLPTLGI
jgi:hypothetical protein